MSSDWKFLIVCMLFAMWITFSFLGYLYKVEMDSYDKRMIAFYDDVFGYMLETTNYTEGFNYTPFKPPQDLSEVVM